MQEQRNPSGKLESIRKLAEIQPSLESLRARARDAKSNLDNILVGLREQRSQITAVRDEAVRREQKEKEFASLIRQREE